MRLTMHTDYALRLLMLLASKQGEPATIQEASERYNISRNHMMKVAHRLGQAGFIRTLRGRRGGLLLAHPPEDINLGAVVRFTEEDLNLVECFDPNNTSCAILPACRLRGVLQQALKAFLAELDRHSLADISGQPARLRELLGLPEMESGTAA